MSFPQFRNQVLLLLSKVCSAEDVQFLDKSTLDIKSDALLGCAPDGFRNLAGPVLVCAMAHAYVYSMKELWELTRQHIGEKGTLLFVIQEISAHKLQEIREDLRLKLGHTPVVRVWNRDNLDHLRATLPEERAAALAARAPAYTSETRDHITTLHHAWKARNLALFLGAGCSVPANVPKWDALMASLVDKWLDKRMVTMPPNKRADLVSELVKLAGSSLTLMAQYLSVGFREDFPEEVRRTLYARVGDDPNIELLKALATLCGPAGVTKVVTYNYDELFERALREEKVDHCVITPSHPVEARRDQVQVIHVHGSMPRDGRISSDIVIEDKGYQRLANSPFSWANVVQLTLLTSQTCLFVGSSMTDPNLRRLLGIARDIHPGLLVYATFENRWKPLLETEGEDFVNELRSLEDSHLKDLGVIPILVDDYSELPELIRTIAVGP